MRSTSFIFKEALLLLALVLYQAGPTHGTSYQPNCSPGYDTDDELDFSEDPGNLAITCNRAFVELICCIRGYRSIRWYREVKGIWKEIQTNEYVYYQKNDLNQTLTLQNPDISEDAGHYKCVAEDGSNNRITNTITLQIRKCDVQEIPPESIEPAHRIITRPLGSSVHIRCRGFFGRGHWKTYSDIYWRKNFYNATGYPHEDFWIPSYQGNMVPAASNINLTYESDQVHIYSAVVIDNITLSDYANYTCQMMNSKGTVYSTTELVQVNATAPRTVIKLHDNPTWRWVVIVISICLGTLSIAGPLIYYFLLDIKLFLRDRFAKVVDDGKECDAFIVYNSKDDADRTFVVKHLIGILEKQHGYKLFIEDRDFPVGVPIANNFMLGVQKCRCIVFVMSPALLKEAWVDYLYTSTADRTDISRVFLIYHQVEDALWQRHQEKFKTAFKVAQHKVKWPESQSSRTISSRSSLPYHSSSSYNTMPKQEVKFWKRLRLHLPKPLSLIRLRQTNLISSTKSDAFHSQSSTSSDKPLVETKPTTPLHALHVI